MDIISGKGTNEKKPFTVEGLVELWAKHEKGLESVETDQEKQEKRCTTLCSPCLSHTYDATGTE